MNRSSMREHVFKMVFSCEFDTDKPLEDHISDYLMDIETTEKEVEYMSKRVEAISHNKKTIDAQLNEASLKWPVDRMSNVDAAILRLMVFEATMDEDIPTTVAINEGLELAKKFGGDQSPKFVNGVIGKIVNG